MKRLSSQPAHDLAREWMDDARDQFPAADFEDLVKLLASEIQTALEDFTNADYREITMKSLATARERREL